MPSYHTLNTWVHGGFVNDATACLPWSSSNTAEPPRHSIVVDICCTLASVYNRVEIEIKTKSNTSDYIDGNISFKLKANFLQTYVPGEHLNTYRTSYICLIIKSFGIGIVGNNVYLSLCKCDIVLSIRALSTAHSANG